MSLNATQEAAIAAISQQQPKNKGTVWCCGEQLKDICRREPDSAALLLTDVTKQGMDIAAAEKKIREFARGNGGAASVWEAEGVLRRFYGLAELTEEAPAEKDDAGGAQILDLADYL